MITSTLPFDVLSEDGVSYEISPFEASVDNVQRLWDLANQHDILFDDYSKGDLAQYVNWLMSPSTVILNVGNIGVVYLTNLKPRFSADAHYFFWDITSKGRHRVLLECMRWGMENFNLHRLGISIPRYANNALHRMYKLGIRLEGVEREARKHNGKWFDVLHFGVLRDEITDEAILHGYLERVGSERGWFGYLGKDTQLMEYINRKG